MFQKKRIPIPGTGRIRRGRWLRYPKTTQEIRVNSFNTTDEPSARGKRVKLPSAWDDKMIRYERSWKSHGKRRKAWLK